MNPQSNGQSPLDYLNQIAPEAPKRSTAFKSKPMMLIVIGLGAVVVVTIVALLVNSVAASRKEPWAQFVVKMNTVETMANSASDKLKSSHMRTLNSSITLFITNTRRDLAPYLLSAGVDAKKLPPAIVAIEKAQSPMERLETGRLNAKYDSTYAREMAYQLGSLLSILQELYAQSSGQATRTYLQTTYNNLAPTQKSLAEFNAINE